MCSHRTEWSRYFSTPLLQKSLQSDNFVLQVMGNPWDVILKKYMKTQFRITITQMFRHISSMWYTFRSGLSNSIYSCSKHVLGNSYTRNQGTYICQDGTIFFKINLKDIWEWSEGTRETEVWIRIYKSLMLKWI